MQKKFVKSKAEILKKELERRGFEVEAIYLFGSYARGEELKTSDIDFIVISRNFSDIPFMRRLDIVNKIVWEKRLGNVEVIPITPEELDKSVVVRDAKKYWIKIV